MTETISQHQQHQQYQQQHETKQNLRNTPPHEPKKHPRAQITEVSHEGFTISGIAASDPHTLQESGILVILHQVKHLWSDGDRQGRTEARRKVRNGIPLENTNRHMSIVYTATFSGNGVRVKFCYNSVDPARWISTGDQHREQSPDQLRRMSNREIMQCMGLFSDMCVQEVQEHLDNIYFESIKMDVEPNYLVALA